jgi:hypothetical protein
LQASKDGAASAYVTAAAVEELVALPAPKRRRSKNDGSNDHRGTSEATEQNRPPKAAAASSLPQEGRKKGRKGKYVEGEGAGEAAASALAESVATEIRAVAAEEADVKPPKISITRAEEEEVIVTAPSNPRLAAVPTGAKKRKLSAVSTTTCAALAVHAVVGIRRKPAPPVTPPPPPKETVGTPAAQRPKLDAVGEIGRILAAEAPEEVLGLDAVDGAKPSEGVFTQAWKKLVLLLHPDKLQRFGEQCQQDGAEALHRVHLAKDELRRRSQEVSVEVPDQPQAGAVPRCSDAQQGSRKYEVSWRLPEAQDPMRPVEAYEIWGPRYFSEGGDPFDWVMLAKLPALQSTFVIVEEAPTQQDVMWAADRVLRPTLPLTVHAVNGRGQSEALTFELPWATSFPWLRGTPSVLCTQCFRMSACRGPWTKCGGCSANVPGESRVVVRCPECQGEVLWVQGSNLLRCTCCLKIFGKDLGQQWRPGTKPLHQAPLQRHQQFKSVGPQGPTPPLRPPTRGGLNGQWQRGGGAKKAW